MLRGAIQSVLVLDPRPTEIVVVDCGSSDATLEVASDFGRDVQILEGTFPNAAAARNAGAAMTTAPYLGFLDSDDLALDAKFGRMAEGLDADLSLGLLHGDLEVINAQGRPDLDGTRLFRSRSRRAEREGLNYADLARKCVMYTSATLIRREAFEDVRGYDERLGVFEDWDLYLRLSRSWGLAYAPHMAAQYRIWEGNVGWDRAAHGVITVARKHLDMLGDMPVQNRRRAEFGLWKRTAASHYSLMELPQARRAALAAVRADPGRAAIAPEIARVLTMSWLPSSMLERRRPQRTTS